MKITKITAITCLLLNFFTAQEIQAAPNTSCDNRFLTLINPVRSRDLWHEKSLEPIEDQYAIIQENNFPATWLLQYDTLGDLELLAYINFFSPNQEKGLLLEISKNLADDSRVLYPALTPWFKPNAVFLSGYSQTDRRKLIDSLFSEYKNQFGVYPKSVGAWWIDSYSLNYMREKYQIASAMIVADQKTTDNYGVWGQWWGVPFYPSKANILTPATNKKNKQNIVILQWAQRDPLRAYGEGSLISNFSLQANDYIRQGKTTEYFKEIADSYLDCGNKIGQITVGLETGIESIGYINEYRNQLEYLKTQPQIKAVTMSEFAAQFFKIYPEVQKENKISYLSSTWELTTKKRENKKLNHSMEYFPDNSFADFFTPDKSEFLNRRLDELPKGRTGQHNFYYLTVVLTAGIFFIFKKQYSFFIFASLFLLSSFGLFLKSFSKFGWNVYYGPVVQPLELIQFLICLIVFAGFWLLVKQKFNDLKNNLFLCLLPLAFGLDYLLSLIRFTVLDNRYLFGFALDTFRFVGFSFSKNFSVQFINQDFEGSYLNAFLKLDFGKVWQNNLLSLVFYPLVHVLIALVLFRVLRSLQPMIKRAVLIVLGLLWLGLVFQIINSDPFSVSPKI